MAITNKDLSPEIQHIIIIRISEDLNSLKEELQNIVDSPIKKKTKGIAMLLNVKEEGNNMSFPKSDTETKVKKKLNNKVHPLRTAKIRIEKDQAGNKYSLRISGRGSEIMSSEECNSRLPH